MKSIELPIVKRPPIICYNHHAHFLSVLFTKDAFINEFFNYYTQLRLTEDDKIIMNFTDIISSSNNNLFDSFRIIFSNSTDVASKSLYDMFDIISHAEKVLSSGYYLTGSWDEKYLPETKVYRKYSLLHDYLIYGFNSFDKTFNIIGYNKTSKYTASLISYEEMKQAFYFPGINTSLVAFKPLERNNYCFDLELFLKNLEAYFNSNPEQDTYYNLEAIKKYLDILTQISLTKSDLDLRILQVIYEHKNTVFERMKYLSQNKCAIDRDYIDKYEYIKKQSLILKNLGLKFNSVKYESIIDDMREILDDIITQETNVLTLFITKLKNL